MPPRMERVTPPRRLGRYQLLLRLGQGSTAEVWKISSSGPSGFQTTRVAKRLLPQLAADAGFIAMLVDEAKLSARLDHPNVVRVFDLEQIDGEHLLTMEYIDGCELRALLAAQARVGLPSVGFALFVAREVCRGLAHAHALVDDNGVALGVVHRDVSPSNILLSRTGAVKLTDFGVANALSHSHTDRAVVQGNLAYMAPEQLAGRPVDARADLYAVGVVLHECLTAQRLWKGAYDVEGMRLLRSRPIAPPSTINTSVSPALDVLCARATAEDPSQRYASSSELEAALSSLLATESFGSPQLAALMRELGPAVSVTPPSEPTRHTMTNVVPPRRSALRWAAASALGLLLGTGAWLTMSARHRETAGLSTASAPVVGAAPDATSQDATVPEATPPAPSHDAPQRVISTRRPHVRKAPDLVRGTLVDPFPR